MLMIKMMILLLVLVFFLFLQKKQIRQLYLRICFFCKKRKYPDFAESLKVLPFFMQNILLQECFVSKFNDKTMKQIVLDLERMKNIIKWNCFSSYIVKERIFEIYISLLDNNYQQGMDRILLYTIDEFSLKSKDFLDSQEDTIITTELGKRLYNFSKILDPSEMKKDYESHIFVYVNLLLDKLCKVKTNSKFKVCKYFTIEDLKQMLLTGETAKLKQLLIFTSKSKFLQVDNNKKEETKEINYDYFHISIDNERQSKYIPFVHINGLSGKSGLLIKSIDDEMLMSQNNPYVDIVFNCMKKGEKIRVGWETNLKKLKLFVKLLRKTNNSVCFLERHLFHQSQSRWLITAK